MIIALDPIQAAQDRRADRLARGAALAKRASLLAQQIDCEARRLSAVACLNILRKTQYAQESNTQSCGPATLLFFDQRKNRRSISRQTPRSSQTGLARSPDRDMQALETQLRAAEQALQTGIEIYLTTRATHKSRII